MKTITIIGGGNSAHVIIPLLSKTDMKINLLTRNPDIWANEIALDYLLPSGEYVDTYYGKINQISSNPEDVIPDADIIMLCMPVHACRLSLHRVAPFIGTGKKVFIGTVYGQAGFNWMTEEIVRKFSLDNITTFAFGLIPWICRTGEYGRKGIVYGAKPLNVAAVCPKEDFNALNQMLFEKVVSDWFGHGSFQQAENFISLTLSMDNQIIHTSRMFGLFLEGGGEWANEENVPYFYKDFTAESARILQNIDDDYSLIRNRIKELYPDEEFTFMLDYLALDNKTNLTSNSTILESFENSKTLGAIRTPVVLENGKWILDKKHRFFHDDIYYGLCIAKWFAQELNLTVLHIDEILKWAQHLLGARIIDGDKLVIDDEPEKNPFKYGTPPSYGYSEIADMIQ